MIFNSYSFIFIFLPVFLCGIWAIQKIYSGYSFKDKLMKMWLIFMSALFFVGFGGFSVLIFAISIIWNYLFAAKIWQKLCDNSKKDRQIAIFKGIAIAGNIVLLCFFKYASASVMPVAISFYTFSQIMYIADLGLEDSFDTLDYLCYITFFPKVLQGPIADYKGIKDGINSLSEKSVCEENITAGIMLFTLGLFKKVILAEVLGKAVDFGYNALPGFTGIDAIILAVSYSFQLYFDFSGYCDMAEGICKMMGIELMQNFDAPYTSVNIAQFWDRWHISLTRFFTRYIYIPLGGSRRGALRTYLNILIIFFISGIWHGTGLTFIVWGMLHGILMVISRFIGRKGTTGKFTAVKTFLTFTYVTVAWVFFRADGLEQAFTLLGKIVDPKAYSGLHISIKFAECFMVDELWYIFKVTPIPGWDKSNYICMWIILIVSAVFIFSGKTAKRIANGSFNVIADKENRGALLKAGVALFYSVLFVWGVLSLGGVSTFLYVNF